MPENNIECMKGVMKENISEDKYIPEERKKKSSGTSNEWTFARA